MTMNVGTIDRAFRLLLGVVLLLAPFISEMALFNSTIVTAISVIAGIVMLVTSLTRSCPLYSIFGIKTCKA
ncbi:Protein of unknown function (DUF2892) [Litoreibacter meonggei]|uniref:Inner membrane protein YgaP-like transmembrane domain-containing protein n=1 Tax=Litoreibacter meonggei TaxID=1049199 RepID=A0A497VC83_9RHOB|nr:DUF2892 domain-containing protein [Litoreibacter meonggei]RLJ40882.1 Protein of unknown function (DUF2892) [Litoreibacter meonggei]